MWLLRHSIQRDKLKTFEPIFLPDGGVGFVEWFFLLKQGMEFDM